MADAQEVPQFWVRFMLSYFQQDFEINSCENARIMIKHAYCNAFTFAELLEAV